MTTTTTTTNRHLILASRLQTVIGTMNMMTGTVTIRRPTKSLNLGRDLVRVLDPALITWNLAITDQATRPIIPAREQVFTTRTKALETGATFKIGNSTRGPHLERLC